MSLDGAAVLVARPEAQAAGLAERISALGGHPVVQPLLEIDRAAVATLAPQLSSLDDIDILVFVSRNAVVHGLELLAACGGCLPAGRPVAAVGPATAAALNAAGVVGVISPGGLSNSEELLKSPVFDDVRGRRILIFRGQDGRELLADNLRARGARVEYAPVYRRRPVGPKAVAAIERWMDMRLPVLVLTSVAVLESLLARVPADRGDELRRLPVAALGERIAAACRQADWRGPVEVAAGSGDAELAAAAARACRRAHDSQTSM